MTIRAEQTAAVYFRPTCLINMRFARVRVLDACALPLDCVTAFDTWIASIGLLMPHLISQLIKT